MASCFPAHCQAGRQAGLSGDGGTFRERRERPTYTYICGWSRPDRRTFGQGDPVQIEHLRRRCQKCVCGRTGRNERGRQATPTTDRGNGRAGRAEAVTRTNRGPAAAGFGDIILCRTVMIRSGPVRPAKRSGLRRDASCLLLAACQAGNTRPTVERKGERDRGQREMDTCTIRTHPMRVLMVGGGKCTAPSPQRRTCKQPKAQNLSHRDLRDRMDHVGKRGPGPRPARTCLSIDAPFLRPCAITREDWPQGSPSALEVYVASTKGGKIDDPLVAIGGAGA